MPTTDELTPAQRQMLATGHWFASLPPFLQEALCTHARVITLRAGEVLFERGDDNDGLYGMLDGAISFGAVNRAGKESVAGLAEPPNWFGEVALLDGGQRTHHARAESDAVIAHVPLVVVNRWLAANPGHWRYLGQLAVHKLRVMFAAVEDAGLYTPRDRLIRCLVSLARAYGQRDASPAETLHLSQERLGTMLSLSRQTINALLQALEQEQLIVCVRGGVRIVDFVRLLALESTIQ